MKKLKYFENELKILRKNNPDSELVIEDFIPEIKSIIEKFSKQGHSGMSAGMYANTLSSSIKKILLYEPLSPLNDNDDEWDNSIDSNTYQHTRDSSIFKHGKDGKSSYLNAIVWQGEEDWDTFAGTVEGISSSQYIKFPFTPKRFYVDVIRVYDTLENINKLGYNYIETDYEDKDGNKITEYYYTKIKDKNQLLKVSKTYDMIDSDRISDEINHFLKTEQRKIKIKRLLDDKTRKN